MQTTTSITTTTTTWNPNNPESAGFATADNMVASSQSKRKIQTNINERTTETPTTKRVIRIFRPNTLYNFGERDQRTWDTNSFPPAKDTPKRDKVGGDVKEEDAQKYVLNFLVTEIKSDNKNKKDAKSTAAAVTVTTQGTTPTVALDSEQDYEVDDRGITGFSQYSSIFFRLHHLFLYFLLVIVSTRFSLPNFLRLIIRYRHIVGSTTKI
ncbi:unnamed protein product [Gongylonema pulchrum]|uniref:Mago-bind domain-containing protein n=1 Tax=Gongylonema pulchrum TaxID=637853 RepID=A0A183D7T5_9BILA|nr:unnamed protein product [Gongylonema pulchrum]